MACLECHVRATWNLGTDADWWASDGLLLNSRRGWATWEKRAFSSFLMPSPCRAHGRCLALGNWWLLGDCFGHGGARFPVMMLPSRIVRGVCCFEDGLAVFFTGIRNVFVPAYFGRCFVQCLFCVLLRIEGCDYTVGIKIAPFFLFFKAQNISGW